MKYALVTGSTKGIGKQIALDLLKSGCFVFLNYANSSDTSDEVELEFSRISKNFTNIKADLSSFEGLECLLKSVKGATEVLDYLILNAGVTDRTEFGKFTPKKWNHVIDANLTIPFFIVQGLSDLLNCDGRIIFIGALMGMLPHAVSIPYGVSKAGLHMLAKYLVKIFAGKRITVNVIAPGFVDTPWQITKEVDHRKRIESKIALGRFGLVSEISSTCMHLIENGYINGQVLVIDGGYDFR